MRQVFYAGMTKAIKNTKKPKSSEFYSIYDYDALQKVIDGSGFFVQVTEEDITYSSTSFGADFSKEMVEALLGLPTGAGELAFASGMIASMGNAGLGVSGNVSQVSSKVANIVFVCEYLMGMPLISAIVVSISTKEVKQAVSIGPCIKESSTHVTMQLHKDVYLFVTPKFIKKYAADLDTVIGSTDYNLFVSYLMNILQNKPDIIQIVDGSNNLVTDILKENEKYKLQGVNFPISGSGSAWFGERTATGTDNQIDGNISFVDAMSISITIPTGFAAKNTTQKAIYLYTNDNDIIVATTGQFKINKD
jgi:hypothetical protein